MRLLTDTRLAKNLVREGQTSATIGPYLGWDILEHQFATDAVYLAFKPDEIYVLLQEQRH